MDLFVGYGARKFPQQLCQVNHICRSLRPLASQGVVTAQSDLAGIQWVPTSTAPDWEMSWLAGSLFCCYQRQAKQFGSAQSNQKALYLKGMFCSRQCSGFSEIFVSRSPRPLHLFAGLGQIHRNLCGCIQVSWWFDQLQVLSAQFRFSLHMIKSISRWQWKRKFHTACEQISNSMDHIRGHVLHPLSEQPPTSMLIFQKIFKTIYSIQTYVCHVGMLDSHLSRIPTRCGLVILLVVCHPQKKAPTGVPVPIVLPKVLVGSRGLFLGWPSHLENCHAVLSHCMIKLSLAFHSSQSKGPNFPQQAVSQYVFT